MKGQLAKYQPAFIFFAVSGLIFYVGFTLSRSGKQNDVQDIFNKIYLETEQMAPGTTLIHTHLERALEETVKPNCYRGFASFVKGSNQDFPSLLQEFVAKLEQAGFKYRGDATDLTLDSFGPLILDSEDGATTIYINQTTQEQLVIDFAEAKSLTFKTYYHVIIDYIGPDYAECDS